MAKRNTKHIKQEAVSSTVKKANLISAPKDLLGIMDDFLDQRLGWLIFVILGITFLFSLLLFDPKVSLSGDDSFYIIRAYDFIHDFKFPTFQGPLYPIVLSIFVAIFGISLVPLKVMSLLFVMGFMYLFFIAFRTRIPSTLLIISLLAMSINSFVLYYASQTYNEAFYLFIQMLLVLVFFRNFIDNEEASTFKQDIKRHLLLSLCLLALALTKNIGYSAVFAVAGYFLLRSQWKNLLVSVAAFFIVIIVYHGVKYMFWSDAGLQFTTQGSGLMNKDYYNPQAGKEDLAGFLTRLIENSNLYLSKHFVSMVGFKKIVPMMTVSSLVTILIYMLSLGSLLITFKKNKYLFFTGLLTGAFLLISFLILQSKWDQNRLIIPAVPMLLLMLLALLYYVSKSEKYKMLQAVVPVVALLILFQSLAVTARSVKENQKVSGRFGGLTPDWKNYLNASEWASVNLPKEAIIACRKPSISFIYGKGRNFYGIMQLPTYSTSAFVNNWMKDDSTYVMFNYADFNGKQLNPDFFSMLKQNMSALLFVGDTVFLVDKINDRLKRDFYNEIRSSGFNCISSASGLKSILDEGKATKLYYPDSLLYQLQNAGVTHILTANLRRNTAIKDGTIINTVERYMAFIQEKYPLIFTKVSQIGDDDNEPATIVKIEYGKYGKSAVKPVKIK